MSNVDRALAAKISAGYDQVEAESLEAWERMSEQERRRALDRILQIGVDDELVNDLACLGICRLMSLEVERKEAERHG